MAKNRPTLKIFAKWTFCLFNTDTLIRENLSHFPFNIYRKSEFLRREWMKPTLELYGLSNKETLQLLIEIWRFYGLHSISDGLIKQPRLWLSSATKNSFSCRLSVHFFNLNMLLYRYSMPSEMKYGQTLWGACSRQLGQNCSERKRSFTQIHVARSVEARARSVWTILLAISETGHSQLD